MRKKLQCQDRSLKTGLGKCSCTTSEANLGSHSSCIRLECIRLDSLHKTLSAHLGSEVEASRLNWSEVPMAKSKVPNLWVLWLRSSNTVKVVNNDFLILKFPHKSELSSCLFFPLSVHLL